MGNVGSKTEFFLDELFELKGRILFAVYDKDFRAPRERTKPCKKAGLVRMGGETSYGIDLRPHCYLFPEHMHTSGTIHNPAAEGPPRLKSRKNNTALGSPEIVF